MQQYKMSKYKDFLIVPLYRNMYNPKGECRLTTIRWMGIGVLLVVILICQQFLVGYPHNDEKAKGDEHD